VCESAKGRGKSSVVRAIAGFLATVVIGGVGLSESAHAVGIQLCGTGSEGSSIGHGSGAEGTIKTLNCGSGPATASSFVISTGLDKYGTGVGYGGSADTAVASYISGHSNGNLELKGNIDLNLLAGRTTYLTSDQQIRLLSGNKIDLTSGAEIDMEAKTWGKLKTGSTLDFLSGENMSLSSGRQVRLLSAYKAGGESGRETSWNSFPAAT
jgi:hypothetical protein